MLAQALALAAEAAEEEAKNPVLPATNELIWGSIAFLVLLALLAKFAFPSLNRMLRARTEKIQGDLERAEQARRESEQVLAGYRQQLASAREESGRVIEEARRTAEQMRKDLQARAEQEAQATVARAQEEIRAERDRVFQELKHQVGQISVDLAERVIGDSLDRDRHARLIDQYIDEVARTGDGRAP